MSPIGKMPKTLFQTLSTSFHAGKSPVLAKIGITHDFKIWTTETELKTTGIIIVTGDEWDKYYNFHVNKRHKWQSNYLIDRPCIGYQLTLKSELPPKLRTFEANKLTALSLFIKQITSQRQLPKSKFYKNYQFIVHSSG